METKICSKCKLEKTVDKFSKDKNNSTGYTYQCKECRNIKYKEYYINNPDKIKLKILIIGKREKISILQN